MPFTPPTHRELIDQIASYFESSISGSTPRLRETIEFALTRALADQGKDLFAFQVDISKQGLPDSADEINFWRIAAIWGIFQKSAQSWVGTYEFEGVDGSEIPDETELERADGATYKTQGAVTIASGTATATIVADVPGSDSENDIGQILNLTISVSGVLAPGEVLSTVTSGTDQETREEGLPRLLQRIRQPPSGGGPGDYVRWSLEVSGFTRAWEFGNLAGPNSVSVAAVRDNATPSIVPDAGQRLALLTYLQSKAPITVDVPVITLTEQTIDLTFSELSPDTADVKTAISVAVADLFRREGGPGVTIPLSRLNEAISGAAGETSNVLSSPSADIVSTTSQVPVVGTVTGP